MVLLTRPGDAAGAAGSFVRRNAMVTMAAPLSTPRTDRTADAAIERVTREEPSRRLMVSIGERCGDRLIEAFERVARAYYASTR
jgi:hypothetical protein